MSTDSRVRLNGESVRLAAFDVERADELVRLWRASFEYGVGVVDPHPLAEQRAFLLDTVVRQHTVRLAMLGERLVGFVAANGESIGQLYVALGEHGRGIGSQLVDWAKAQSGGTLWLYTFAQNQRACRFYEKRGFRATERGIEPHWKLADVRYEWERP